MKLSLSRGEEIGSSTWELSFPSGEEVIFSIQNFPWGGGKK